MIRNDHYLMSESKEHSKVAEFLFKLQEDSKLLSEFKTEPDKLMIEAGISSEKDRNTIKSGDIVKIRALLQSHTQHEENDN